MNEQQTRVIAVMNQQPQTGKTRLTAGLGQALANAGHSVLLIDMATQGDLSTLFASADKGIGHVLQGEDWSEAMTHHDEQLAFVGYQGLSEFELSARDVKAAYVLKKNIQQLAPVDFVLIDTASRKGLLSMNVLLAVDEIIIPASSSSRVIEGLQTLIPTIQRIDKQRDSRLKIWLAMVDCPDDAALIQMVQLTLENFFPERLLRTTVPASENDQTPAYAELAKDLINGETFHG